MRISQDTTDAFENVIDLCLQSLFVGCLRAGYRHLIENVHLLVAYSQFTRLLIAQNEECDSTHHRFDGSDYVRGDALLEGLDVDDGDDTPMQEDGEAGPGSGSRYQFAPVGIRAEVLNDHWFLSTDDVCKILGQAFLVEVAFSAANDGGGDVHPSLDAQPSPRTDRHESHTARRYETCNHLYGPLYRLPVRTFLEDALQFVQLDDTSGMCRTHINCILATIGRFSNPAQPSRFSPKLATKNSISASGMWCTPPRRVAYTTDMHICSRSSMRLYASSRSLPTTIAP